MTRGIGQPVGLVEPEAQAGKAGGRKGNAGGGRGGSHLFFASKFGTIGREGPMETIWSFHFQCYPSSPLPFSPPIISVHLKAGEQASVW